MNRRTMELQARKLLVKQQKPPRPTRANKTHVTKLTRETEKLFVEQTETQITKRKKKNYIMTLRKEMGKLFKKRKQILEELKNLEENTTPSKVRKEQTQLIGEINNQQKGYRTINKRAWNQRDGKIRKTRTRRPTEKPWPKKPGGQSEVFSKKVRIQFVWGVRC